MSAIAQRLDRPLDPATDHVLGNAQAPISVVEYGSYACPHCRSAHERVVELRREFGEQMVYAFRHRPVPGNALAKQAAELVERAETPKQFWSAHVALMTRSHALTAEDLRAVAHDLDLPLSDMAEQAAGE